MLTDKKWYFQDSVGTAGDDITATTTATIASKSIDTRKVLGTTDKTGMGFADGGTNLYLYVRLKTLGAATIHTVALQDSADDSTFADVLTKVIPSASFVANGLWRIPLPMGLRRFIRATFTNTTTGSNVLNAWIAP